jgi:vacuolar-type H+-ATPase subunit E/Vma4
MKHAYGTVECYFEQFSDILADVDAKDSSYGENIVKGFYAALDDWLDYHKNQTEAYAELRRSIQEAILNG